MTKHEHSFLRPEAHNENSPPIDSSNKCASLCVCVRARLVNEKCGKSIELRGLTSFFGIFFFIRSQLGGGARRSQCRQRWAGVRWCAPTINLSQFVPLPLRTIRSTHAWMFSYDEGLIIEFGKKKMGLTSREQGLVWSEKSKHSESKFGGLALLGLGFQFSSMCLRKKFSFELERRINRTTHSFLPARLQPVSKLSNKPEMSKYVLEKCELRTEIQKSPNRIPSMQSTDPPGAKVSAVFS